MVLSGMKVGPSLKISDLIQQLRIKVNPAQERAKAGYKKLLQDPAAGACLYNLAPAPAPAPLKPQCSQEDTQEDHFKPIRV